MSYINDSATIYKWQLWLPLTCRSSGWAPHLTMWHGRRCRRWRHRRHGNHVWCNHDGRWPFLNGWWAGGPNGTTTVTVIVRWHNAVVTRIRVIVTQLEVRLRRWTVQRLLGLVWIVGTHGTWKSQMISGYTRMSSALVINQDSQWENYP